MGGDTISEESDNQLKQYLLGELGAAGEEQVELRLLTEPGYVKELDIVVNKLIDRYVAGGFEGEERERVTRYFFKSTERQDKLRFALALKGQGPRGISPKEPKRKPFNSRLAIAASVFVVVGISFGVWQAFRNEPDPENGLAALEAAFREERPTEARLSDFKYAPVPNQRGGAPKVDHVQRDLAANLLLTWVSKHPDAASHHAAGKYYLMGHEFERAEQELAAAIALDPQNAKIHNDLGAALLEEGRIQRSGPDRGKELEIFGRSLNQLQKALELDSSLLEPRFNRALLFQYMMPSKQAEAAWREYLQNDATSPWADEARRNLKLIEEDQGRTLRGKNNNIRNFLQAHHDSDDSTAWKVISENYTSAGNEITNFLVDSLLGLESGSEVVDRTTAFPALSYSAQLEVDRAGDHYASELVSYYKQANPKIRSLLASARRHMRTGYMSFEQSKFTAAIHEYTKAKLKYEQAGDSVEKAFVEYRLAHCYVLLPDLEKARLAFNQLLMVCERNQYRWLAGQCLFGLAHASADASEYSKAIDYSNQALARFEQTGDLNGALKCLTQLADFNQAVNQVGKSLVYLGKALNMVDSTPSEPLQRWGILNQIGFSLSSMQLYAAALFYQKEALALAVEMSRPLIISRSYSYVGSAYSSMKMYPEALSEATRAFEIGRSIPGDPGGVEIIANASQQLGDINREAGKCEEAVKNYNVSIRLYRRLNFDYYSYVAHKGKLLCFVAASDKRAVRKELGSVLRRSELFRSKITAESQRISFFDMEQSVYDLAISYESGTEKDFVKAFEYSEESRARSLLDAVQRGAEVRRKHGEPDLNLPVVTFSMALAEIQKKMPTNAQILQYAVLDDRLLVWVVTKTSVKHEEVPVGAQALTEKISAYLETVKQPPTGTGTYQTERAEELYTILIAPVEALLDKSKILAIVPDKILNYLPFGALTSPTTANYLIEDYDLDIAPSGSLFVYLSAAAERKAGSFDERLLSVGNPDFSRAVFSSLSKLPSSALESRAVSDFYPKHKVLLRDEATETAVKSEIETADVAHFAMHFVLNEQSEMLSGFPLAPEAANARSSETPDGFLQSYEIYSMKLRSTRLVVLSACQTGIERQYRGEGAVGAARPFLVAGVPVVVASLWAVDSDASVDLMVSFHRHRHEPLPVTKALKQAQIEMIHGTQTHYRHPYYWAPFLVIGGLSRY